MLFRVTSTHEELLNLVSLYGTTKGSDIFEVECNCVDSYGGFDKSSSIATDGAKAMVGEQKGFSGFLRRCLIQRFALAFPNSMVECREVP
jgi:hypothetical protein